MYDSTATGLYIPNTYRVYKSRSMMAINLKGIDKVIIISRNNYWVWKTSRPIRSDNDFDTEYFVKDGPNSIFRFMDRRLNFYETLNLIKRYGELKGFKLV